VLTNLIQADAAPSDSANNSALPFQSAGPVPSSFASTLQSARALAPTTPGPELPSLTAPGKSAEKKTAENSRMTASGKATPAAAPAVIGDVKSPSVVAVSLATVPPLPQPIAGLIATAGSIPPPASSLSDGTTDPLAGADSAEQVASVGLAREFQRDALPHTGPTVLDSASSTAALAPGKPTQTGGLTSSPNAAGAPVKPMISFPVGEIGSPLSPLSESGPRQSAVAAKTATAPGVASPESDGTSAADLAVLDTPTPRVSPSVAELAATITDPPPVLSTSAQTEMPPDAMNPTSGTAAAVGANQSVQDGTLQAGNSDLRPGQTTTPIQSSMPPDAIDATRSPNAADGKPQVGNDDLRAMLLDPTQNPMPSQAIGATSATAMATGVDQSASDRKPQSGSGSGGTMAGLASSLTVSKMESSAEILKHISLSPAIVTKGKETNPAGEARAKETSTEKVSSNSGPSNPVSSNSGSSNPGPSNPVSSNPAASNQQSARSKPSDSSSNPADTNTQSLSASSLPASPAGPASGNNPPSGTAVTASILAQVSPTANQDSGGQSSASPAAGPQLLAASPTPAVPMVGPVEIARMVAGVAQSEMHIGLRTQAFGSVEVHTVVRDSQVGLSVGSERGDLRTFLATEVSGLQTTFRQQDLRFDNIRFLETSAGTTAGFSGGADSQPRSSSQQHSSPVGVFSIHGPPEDSSELDTNVGLRTRLNVHA
jgi:hypothetical protein